MKLINTRCGIDKFEKLKKETGFFKKIRFYWFVFFATIRDSILRF